MQDFPKMSKWKFAVAWCLSTWFGLIRLYKYNADWDKELNRLLDNHWQTARTELHTVMLSDLEVWTANAFYGYGNNYGRLGDRRWGKGMYRPSIKTMWRLESLRRYLVEQEAADTIVARLNGDF
jgi:hypothetical protein